MRLTAVNLATKVAEMTIKHSNLPERYIKRSMEVVSILIIPILIVFFLNLYKSDITLPTVKASIYLVISIAFHCKTESTV